MTITYAVAMAAGLDAGNANMRAAGRTEWNEEDWDVAADIAARLVGYEGVQS
jgi:hypothetical protein